MNLKIHSTFALGDLFMSKIYLAFSDESSSSNHEKAVLHQEELMSPMDQACELNVYPLLAHAVYVYIKADAVDQGDNEYIQARD